MHIILFSDFRDLFLLFNCLKCNLEFNFFYSIALAPSISFLENLSLQTYLAFQDRSHKTLALAGDADWDNIPFGLKLQAVVGSYDISVSFIKEVNYTAYGYEHYYYAGADFVGAIWDIGVYGEASLRLPRMADGTPWDFSGNAFSDLIDLAVGFDYTVPLIYVLLHMEYYHYSRGEHDKNNYDIGKLLGQETLMLGEDYVFLYAEKVFETYFTLNLAGFVNCNDSSLALIPRFGYDVYSNLQLTAGGFLFSGSTGSESDGRIGTLDITQPGIFIKAKLSF